MGDRVIVVFKDRFNEYSPGVYLHASGNGVLEMVEAAVPFMRAGDIGASAAGFFPNLKLMVDEILG